MSDALGLTAKTDVVDSARLGPDKWRTVRGPRGGDRVLADPFAARERELAGAQDGAAAQW